MRIPFHMSSLVDDVTSLVSHQRVFQGSSMLHVSSNEIKVSLAH
jgi:hypothetical protein